MSRRPRFLLAPRRPWGPASRRPPIAAALLATFVVSAAAAVRAETSPDPERVYRIGNSFTWDSRPDFMDVLSESTPTPIDSAYHIRCSSSLAQIASDMLTCVPPLEEGRWQEALAGHEWDHLIVQSFRSSGSTLATDVASIQTFWDELQQNPTNADTQLLLYQSWPFDVGGQSWDNWLAPAGTTTQHRQAYYKSLRDALEVEGLELKIIPNADVLYHVINNLDEFDAIDEQSDLYRDNIHLRGLGQFIVATTVLTYLNGEDLTGATTGNYSVTFTDAERDQLQTAIWKIVNAVQNPGDLNADGSIDMQDFHDWKAGFGGSAAGLDGNLDGVVDGADYTIWRDAFESTTSASVVTPEPTGLAVAVGFVLASVVVTRRRIG